jgi:glycosyltransferase involved in cell wall biosynthesis
VSAPALLGRVSAAPTRTAGEPGRALVARPLRGGVGAYAARTIAELRANGWEVDEVPLSDEGAPMRVALGAATSHRRALSRADVLHVELGCLDLAPFWFAALASRGRPLVVVAHDAPRVALAPGSGLIRTGTRWRDVVGHRMLSPALDGVLARRFARQAAVGVVLSERARSNWALDAPRRILVADHGADPPTHGTCSPSGGRYVLFAGYVGPGKGIDTLLEAWSLIGDRIRLPLVITGTNTGGADDTRYEDGLRELSSRLPAPPTWLGFVDDQEFARLIAEAAVVVAPYRRSNPASGVLVRAMVEGRAIVATRVPAALDCLEHGVSGLLVEPDDPRGLGEALERVVAEPALRDQLGAAAARRAAARFTWQRYVERLTDAYRVAIGSA